VLNSEIPMLAALETPDTPRAWHIYKDMRNFEKMIMLSAFMPNSILFINNGMETKEIQPMNLGLENTEEGRYVLLHNHPFYGKLSFFDNYCLEWNNEDAYHIINVIKKAFSLKQDYASVFADKNFIPFENRDKLDVIALSYYINNEGISLLINCSVEKVNVSLEQLFNIKHLSIQKHKIECISACSKADAVSDLETWELNSLECSIIHILKSGKEN
jgi:hypothetical protein